MRRSDEAIRVRAGESAGERIRRRRKELQLTQNSLAAAAGVNQGYLSAIEQGKANPRKRTIDALAVALDLPQAVLIGGGREHDNPQPLETREVPLFGTIPAGPPAVSQEQLEMFPVLRHQWSPEFYCLRLSYDSMEPTLKPGDIVLVHYRPDVEPEHVQGRICACLVDGQPTLKRVTVEWRGPEKTVILRGDNPRTAPILVDPSREFLIQGIVVRLVCGVISIQHHPLISIHWLLSFGSHFRNQHRSYFRTHPIESMRMGLLAENRPLAAVADILEAARVVGPGAWKRDGHRMASEDASILSRDVLDLFTILRDRRVDYALVGGVALMKYVEARNTEDIDILSSAQTLDRLPELTLLERDHDVARAMFRSVRVDVLLTADPVFKLVHDHYATVHPFQEISVRCATVEGLVLLKLYALPSLYRQQDTRRIALYETDILMLLDRCRPDMDKLWTTLHPFIDEGAHAELANVIRDIQQRITRMRRS